ncbi:hypothetical protein [Kribbella antiqua]|nr:hypothetical protein [Kribbella antiqua]
MSTELVIAAVGVGGTLMASALAFTAQVTQLRSQHKWSRQEAEASWQREREARLFERRRNASTEFLSTYERYYAVFFPYVWDLDRTIPPPDYDTFDELSERVSTVEIYGSIAVADRAHELVSSLSKWTNIRADEREGAEKALHEARKRFTAAARADLGVSQ